MIEVYDYNPDKEETPISWTSESGPWEFAFLYPNFVELIAGSEHTVISLKNIDSITWQDGDKVKIMF